MAPVVTPSRRATSPLVISGSSRGSVTALTVDRCGAACTGLGVFEVTASNSQDLWMKIF
jgi:hypothetical protein